MGIVFSNLVVTECEPQPEELEVEAQEYRKQLLDDPNNCYALLNLGACIWEGTSLQDSDDICKKFRKIPC